MSVIVTERLTKRYGRRIGVADLNLDVPEGTLFGFLGPNGSGKTTAIRILMGFLRPTQGRAKIFGLDCWNQGHRLRRDVGYLPGDLRLYPWLTCREGLDIFGKVRRCDLRTAGNELAAAFGLEPDVKVRNMSRGMRQKLGLILALAHKPKLLVLDEPTSTLDPIMQGKLCQHLRTLAACGHTVFFSSHSLAEVERLCSRVVILRQGRLAADETLDDLRARASRAVTIRWGTPAAAQETRPPAALELIERSNRHWRGTLVGPVTALVSWCAQQPIDDISIEQPDLNTLFQGYYADAGDDT